MTGGIPVEWKASSLSEDAALNREHEQSNRRKCIMKKWAVLIAVMIAAAFVPAKASAAGLILNASGTIKFQGTNGVDKGAVSSFSFSEKSLYSLISSIVANDYDTLGTNIAPTNLPASGYIVYNPNKLDANTNYGVFYVTNKSGFYYQLSGRDKTNGYYNFIELDTYIIYGPQQDTIFPYYFDLGYGEQSSDVATYSLSGKTGAGSGTDTSTGVLCIHDDPYTYDDLDDPDTLLNRGNSYLIEIRGLVTASYQFKEGIPSISSISITGTGNAILEDNIYLSLVSSGHATLAP
jgi:hypothetical protein